MPKTEKGLKIAYALADRRIRTGTVKETLPSGEMLVNSACGLFRHRVKPEQVLPKDMSDPIWRRVKDGRLQPAVA